MPTVQDVAILETLGSGHRLAYVNRIVHAAAKAGRSAVVVTRPAVRASHDEEWSVHLQVIDDSFRSISVPAHQAFDRDVLRAALSVADLLCIPDGDRWLSLLLRERLVGGRKRRVPVQLLVMRPYRPAGLPPRIRFASKRLLMRILERPVFRVQIGVLLAAGAQTPPCSGRTVVVRDPPLSTRPLPDREEARRTAALSGVVIAVLGVVDERKNPLMVLHALESLAERHPEETWVLYLPGQLAAGVLERLEAHRTAVRLVTGGGYLDADAYAAAFAASDVIAVVHQNEGSSGVLNEAAAYGKRTVAGGTSSVREQGMALGAVVPANNTVGALADSIFEAHRRGAGAQSHIPTGVDFEQFFLRANPVG